MKVLLMMPPMSIKDNYANLETVAANMPSLGLAYIFSAFEEAGCEVRFKDYQGQKISIEEITDYIESEQFDMVGMQTYITNINTCFEVSAIIKNKIPNIKTILGGAHATIFPDMVIKHPAIDFVCISEAEYTVKELVECLNNGQSEEGMKNILGLFYKDKNGKVCKNPSRPLEKDLDNFPMPKYEIFNASQYYPAVHIRGKRVQNMITSRGCPFKCTFCAATRVYGSTFRYISVERSIKEMKLLKEKFNTDSLQIYDDNFTTNKKRVIELCKRMIEEKLNFKWVCYTRADLIGDEEMLLSMKKAGCYLIVVGMESGNERILKLINKKLDLNVARKNLKLANKCKINVLSSFMIGLPSATVDEIENTIRFSTSVGLTYATYPIFTPYPGTPIYEDAKFYGTIHSQNFDEYSRWGDGIYSTKGLSPQIYRKLQTKAFRTFYFRPSILWKIFLEFTKLPFPRMIRFIKGGTLFFLSSIAAPARVTGSERIDDKVKD